MGLFGGSKSSSTSNYSANQTTIDASANAAGASTINASQKSRIDIDNSTDNSVDLKGNVGTTSGDGNTVLGTGASILTETNTYNVQEVSGEIVNRTLESLDKGTEASYQFAGAAMNRALDSADAAYAGGFAFGNRALTSADSAYSGGLGFGKEALDVVASFGTSTIQNANARADSALAAVERLAAVPTDRNGAGAQDSRVVLFILGGLALLALLLGRSRPAKS